MAVNFSGSLVITGSLTTTGGITISGSIASASFASTASFVALAQSASNAVAAQTASFANAFTVAGNLTAQTLVVQTITSSVDFVTGSTRFGSLAANTHVFSGSVTMNPNGLFVSSSGNVGIGTTTDVGYKLDVNGTGRFSSSITSARLFTGGGGLRMNAFGTLSQTISGEMTILGHNVIADQSSSNTVTVINGGWYSSMIKLYYSEGITFHTSPTVYSANATYPMSDTERMRITSGGNVGIGLTNPTDPFVVQTNTNSQTNITFKNINTTNTDTRQGLYLNAGNNTMSFLTINGGGGNYIQGTAGNDLYFQQTAGGTVNMVIKSGGNVLIGTTSDTGYKLNVNGSARIVGGAIADRFITDSGTASIPYGSYATFYTVQNYQNAIYLVTLQLNGYSNYTAFATIIQNDSNLQIANSLSNVASIQVSGLNIQGTNGSGITQSMPYKIIRIS